LVYYCNFKTINRKVFLNILEAFIHGGIIIGAVLLTLPQVRLNDGRLLPEGALHMSVFILLVIANNIRYLFLQNITKLRFLVLTIKTIFVFSLTLFVASMMSPKFAKGVAYQTLTLFSTYDSCTMIINTFLFCLAVSFFI
jgi:hypothetical protein